MAMSRGQNVDAPAGAPTRAELPPLSQRQKTEASSRTPKFGFAPSLLLSNRARTEIFMKTAEACAPALPFLLRREKSGLDPPAPPGLSRINTPETARQGTINMHHRTRTRICSPPKPTPEDTKQLGSHHQCAGTLEAVWNHSALSGRLLHRVGRRPDWPDRAKRLRQIDAAGNPLRARQARYR